MTTVLISDDHAVVRIGLHALLDRAPGIEVCGEAVDGLETLRLCEQLHPDVLLVDVSLPDLSGLEVARQTRLLSPGTRVVVHSMHADEHYVLEALKAGAVGYVLKASDAAEIVAAIQAAAEGRRYLSPLLADRAFGAYVDRAEARPDDPFDALTARERTVFYLAAEGLKVGEIGRRLSLSPRTAETHRAALMRKLGLRTQTELVQYAMHRGVSPAG
jgi:DNA-binding NarL/FixJ family response regulator